jgi:ribosomal protein S18 acetylase RimI-like enzyme
MPTPTTSIRPMTPADVQAAAAAVFAGNWGDRTEFFRFATGSGACLPFVAVGPDGAILGTGVGAVHGSVGWVGTIFVAREARRRGLGVALTTTVTEALESAGCRTLMLVATEHGRPLYERLGFELQSTYHTLEAPGLAAARLDPAMTGVRPFEAADLDAMARLDADATGEDRRHLLAAFATPESARCLVGRDGTVRGFVVRAPWGGGATIAPDPDDATTILEARRIAAGPERRVRAGVLAENGEGLRRLLAAGWTEAWSAPRLARGEPLAWRPEAIWGQFNHALG